jgi:DNA segregation ATPase FtsK/SpoIIIE, S-DNA-T family
MAAFRSEYEFQSHSKVFDGLLQILTDGRQVGGHVVLTADRPGALSPSVASAVPRRLVLRLADATDYASFELPQDVLGPDSPPGRCLFDRLETQVATLRGAASVVEQGIALDELGARLRAEGVAQAPAVRSLPERVALADVADAARPDLLPIGIADDTLAPAGIEPAGTFMISGPSGSGRTTALRTIARMAGRVGGFRTVLLSAWARTTLDAGEDAALWQTVLRGPDAVREALPELTTAATVPATADHRLCLVVEDISGFLGSGVDTSLTELLKTARRAGHLVVAEAETSDWGQSWPLIMELRRGRRGLALQPDQQDGDLLFRTSFPRVSRSGLPEGRGYLIERGRAREIQVARWARPRDGSAGAEATCAPG